MDETCSAERISLRRKAEPQWLRLARRLQAEGIVLEEDGGGIAVELVGGDGVSK